MPLIDDHGRLFGRLNIVDAAVLLVVALLIPMAYGAYLIFQAPSARIDLVTPRVIQENTAQVTLSGVNLRPYLRVSVAGRGVSGDDPSAQHPTFLFGTTSGGVLQLPALRPGAYDVVLLDEENELGRISGGLIVEAKPAPPPPPPLARVVAVGRFTATDPARVEALFKTFNQGDSTFSWGEILGTQPLRTNGVYVPNGIPVLDRYSLTAVIQFDCVRRAAYCNLDGSDIVPGGNLQLSVGSVVTEFNVDEVHPSYSTTVDILMRCQLTSEEVRLLNNWRPEERGGVPAWNALRASLVSFEVIGEGLQEGQLITMVRMRVPVVETVRGWVHTNRVIRIGQGFSFVRPSHFLQGLVVDINRTPPVR